MGSHSLTLRKSHYNLAKGNYAKSTDKQNAAAAVKAAASDDPVPNCSWTNNNLACVNTWFCLSEKVLGQTDSPFDSAGILKMTDLEFWNKVARDDNRAVEAGALADMLTKPFTNMLGATYESGQYYASATIAMVAILTDANKTVCELAAVNDEVHHFIGEPQ